MNDNELERLRAFRSQWYRLMECRRDALCEIMDALLMVSVIESPAHLSLAPGFQRKWGSVYDALNQGMLASERWERLLDEYPLETATHWYAIDGSVWPRCDARSQPRAWVLPSRLSSLKRATDRGRMELLLVGSDTRKVL